MKTPDKQRVLADLAALVAAGKISFPEIKKLYAEHAPDGDPAGQTVGNRNDKARRLSTALYIVGTLIICFSIFLLISQNWDQLNTFWRIVLTQGIGVLLLGLGDWRVRRVKADVRDEQGDLLTGSLLTIGSAATVIGAGVVLTEAGGSLNEPADALVLGLLLTPLFVLGYRFLVRHLALMVTAIALFVGTYYAGVNLLVRDMADAQYVYQASTIVLGLLLGGLGYAFRTRQLLRRLTDVLYVIAAFLVLGGFAMLTFISGSGGHGDLAFDLLYPFVLAGAVAASVQLNNRGILIATALFLTIYIFQISLEYFSGLLGGSVALTFAGILVLGMAYGATRFAQRFIK